MLTKFKGFALLGLLLLLGVVTVRVSTPERKYISGRSKNASVGGAVAIVV